MVGFATVELVLLAAVLWFGKIRGWSLAAFGFRISWKGTGASILLFVVTEVAMIGVGVCAQSFHPEQSRYNAGQLAVPLVLLLSVINPVYEEVLGVAG